MKKLLKRHYKTIVNRGLITPDTEVSSFIHKIIEEYHEVLESISYPTKLNNKTKQECVDLVMVVFNMFNHFDINIEKELIKNIETQEKRCKTLQKKN